MNGNLGNVFQSLGEYAKATERILRESTCDHHRNWWQSERNGIVQTAWRFVYMSPW